MLRHSLPFLAAFFASLSLVTAEESVSLVGEWKVTSDTPQSGEAVSTLVVSKKDSKLVGQATLPGDREAPIKSIEIDGKKVVIEMDFEYNGNEVTIRVRAEQSEKGKLSGKWFFVGADGDEKLDLAWAAVRTSAPPEEAAESVKSASSIAGKWNAKSTSGDGEEMASVVTFTKAGDTFKGTSKSDQGRLDFDSVKVDGKEVEIELTFDYNGADIPITIRAEHTKDDQLKGKWLVFDESGQEVASGAWNAERALMLDLAGTWNVLASSDNGDIEHQASFEKADSGFKGTATSDAGTADYDSVTVTDNAVNLELPFGEGVVKVAATYAEKDKLTGKWHYFDASDSEVASDAWVAIREVKEAPKPVSVAGEWAIEITFGDNDPRDYSIKISEDGDALQGVFISPRSGETKCDTVTFKDGALAMKVTRDIQGSDIEFIYEGKLAGEKLSGTVVPKGYEDQFSGTWTGVRKE